MTIPIPVPVSQFPAATLPLTGDEAVPLVQAGVTSQVPASALGANAFSGAGQGDIFYGEADASIARLPKDSTPNRYLSNRGTNNNPQWSELLITTDDLEVGYLDVPQRIANTNPTFLPTDRGKHVYADGSVVIIEWLIPLNTTVAFPIGTCITLVNNQADPIPINTEVPVTLIQAGVGVVGSLNLAQYGMATILKVETDTWVINGVGLS